MSARGPDPRDLEERLIALDRQIDAGRYRSGTWQALLRDLRRLPRPDRAALAGNVSRVSEKLHGRTVRRRLAFSLGIGVELAVALLGAGLLWLAVAHRFGWAAIAADLIWIMTLQPIIKVLVGSVLGIRYAYAFFLGPEPRFKMRYGTLLAAPRAARIILHLSGAIGSPLGAWLPIPFVHAELPQASLFCWLLFGIAVAVNAASFVLALLGLRRIGPLQLSLTSPASAAMEIREALQTGH